MDEKKSTQQRSNSSSTTNVRIGQYLILYNLISAFLWFVVLSRVSLLLPMFGPENVYGGVGEFAKWTQTLAVAEIAHSALGLVRSPLLTSAMQVFSRLLLVWGIVDRYPSATTPSPIYSSMLIAWSFAEIIRYTYFVQNLRMGGMSGIPEWLVWLRYNAFFVLYPLGIGSEVVMMWKASRVAEPVVRGAIWVVLGLYVPGSYILYTHMMAQRRKVMRGKAPVRKVRARVPTM